MGWSWLKEPFFRAQIQSFKMSVFFYFIIIIIYIFILQQLFSFKTKVCQELRVVIQQQAGVTSGSSLCLTVFLSVAVYGKTQVHQGKVFAYL